MKVHLGTTVYHADGASVRTGTVVPGPSWIGTGCAIRWDHIAYTPESDSSPYVETVTTDRAIAEAQAYAYVAARDAALAASKARRARLAAVRAACRHEHVATRVGRYDGSLYLACTRCGADLGSPHEYMDD